MTPPAAEPALLIMMSTRPSALCGLFDEVLGVAVFAQVAGDRNDLAAGFLGDFLGRGFERLHAPRADRDVDAFLGERERDALADAFTAAGDQRGFAFELEIHRRILL